MGKITAMSTPASLPDSVEDLQHLVLAMQAEMDAVRLERDTLKSGRLNDKQEIERLTLLLAKLQRMLFGQKSEKLVRQIEQLELELEELHIKQGDHPVLPEPVTPPTRTAPVRKPLPEHLPRDIREHLPQACCCPDCGGAWQRIGEDVSEVLDYVPASVAASAIAWHRHRHPAVPWRAVMPVQGCSAISWSPNIWIIYPCTAKARCGSGSMFP